MSRYTLFAAILAFALLLCAGGVEAQENVLYIEISITDYSQTASPPELTPVNQDFLDQLTSFLSDQGITPILVSDNDRETYPYFWEQPALHLSFFNLLDRIALYVTPYVTMQLPVSSALEAAFSVTSIVTINPEDQTTTDAALTLTKGMAYYALGRWDDAIAIFNQLRDSSEAFTDNPYTPASIQFYLASSLLETGKPEEARELYEAILNDSDHDLEFTWSAAVNLGWLDLQEGREDEAFEQLTQAIDNFSNNDDSYVIHPLTRRSQLYALAFRFDEAVADMDAAIELDPDNPTLYIERGQRLLLLYEWDRALADYNRAIELDPNYADAYYYRGVLYASVPEGFDARVEAIADFQHYLELNPNGAHAQDAQRYLSQIQSQLDSLEATPETTPES
jgi:tetratricopeptide (TPR) repeat protein